MGVWRNVLSSEIKKRARRIGDAIGADESKELDESKEEKPVETLSDPRYSCHA